MKLVDQFDRTFTYLRIGVTDRCNLRCTYCMPAKGIDFSRRKDLLSYEEILRLGKIFRSLGVNKVRLTGGEPFVRKDMMSLLSRLTDIFPSVHITSNATLLGPFIGELKELGISGMNISIDSLQKEKFNKITRRNAFDEVMDNILNSVEAGISVKLNVVTMKGVNDDEIIDFVEFGSKLGTEVRFIEAMPFNASDGNKDVFLSAKDIRNKIEDHYGQVSKLDGEQHSSAEKFDVLGKSHIGIIPAYSRSLCGMCNRIRLTPKGELMNCLYKKQGIDLLSILRDPSTSDQKLIEIIQGTMWNKKVDGFATENAKENNEVLRSMTTIGG